MAKRVKLEESKEEDETLDSTLDSTRAVTFIVEPLEDAGSMYSYIVEHSSSSKARQFSQWMNGLEFENQLEIRSVLRWVFENAKKREWPGDAEECQRVLRDAISQTIYDTNKDKDEEQKEKVYNLFKEAVVENEERREFMGVWTSINLDSKVPFETLEYKREDGLVSLVQFIVWYIQ